MLHDITCADVSNWPSPKYQDLVMIHLAAKFLRSFFCPVSMWQAHLQLHLCSLGCRCVAVWRGCYDRKVQERNVHYWCSNMFQLLYEKVLLPWYESSCCSTFAGKHSDKFMMLESDQAQGLIPDVVSLGAYLQRCGHLGWPQAHSWYSNVFYAFPQQNSSCFCYVCGSKCFCVSRGFRPRYPSRNPFWYVGTGKSILPPPGPYRSICGAIRILLRRLLLHWTSGPV